jgi:1,4-alpha-glucan branching enzyme
MKNRFTLLFILLMHIFAFSQITVSYSVSPSTFDETEAVTVTFTVNENSFGVASTHSLYLWAWSFDSANVMADSPTNGTWSSSGAANKLTYTGGTSTAATYTYTMNTVKSFYGNRTNPLKTIGFLVKSQTGTYKSQDIVLPVGKFQLNLTNPVVGSTNFLSSGSNVVVSGTTSLAATYKLKANGTVVNSTSAGSTSYSYSYNVTQDASMELEATSTVGGDVQKKSFTIVTTPSVQTAAIPSWMRQGINYDAANPNKVGLAIYAPGKSFIHVIGSFNNWTVSNAYLMKKDTTNPDLYWIEITGLTPQQIYTFQYRTNDGKKVADPYSRLVLSPDDDPYIQATDYPNLPVYPTGQQYDVSVVQTGMPTYNWQVSNFTKPAKENLIVYELCVRDFSSEQNFQAIIDKIDYFKNLGVNAIELMPVMEFEGNNSWGYNPSFHFALDKAYGTSDKFKELIDTFHQNGIAVILDVALNHATQRNPLVRLWNTDPDGDGYGVPNSSNPYFNTVAKHTYGVNEDFNHSSTYTKYYVERVLEQWITEYKVDGFRWDLTKGFTQNCTTTDEACTGSYQQDRVDILKGYADKQWSFDPSSYVIFEHLGTDNEEKEWANYRIAEGKGVIMWDNINGAYSQNTMGYSTNSNINRADFENHSGFSERRNVTYGESHDEERLMYKNLQYGAANGSYNVKTLATALERQKAVASVLYTIPGPKMLWQFGELGYDYGINRCTNGTYSTNCRTDPKPSAFDTSLNYFNNTQRKAIYDIWSKIINLRLNNPVFNTKTFEVNSGDLLPRIYIWDDALPSTTLKNVVVIANFNTSVQSITPYFPYTGTWYNLMDNSTYNVTNTTATISLQPGEFRIYGNATPILATDDITKLNQTQKFEILQNPVVNGIAQVKYSNAKGGTLYIYDMTGKMLKTQPLKTAAGQEVISVSTLQKGVYMIMLKSEQGVSTSKFIIK